MNVADLAQRLQLLEQQNQRLRQAFTSGRNSDSYAGNTIDFETKYKKALKQIYEVIQANKQLKDQLENFKTSRVQMEGNMADVRKEQIYKVYESVLNEKNELKEKYHSLQSQNQQYQSQVDALEAQINVLRGENMYLAQQKQAFQAKALQGGPTSQKGEQVQVMQQRYKQKQQQYHRTLQNYQQHHIQLTNQSKKNQERVIELQQRLVQNDKNWRNRFQSKEIQFKEIRSSVRHEYQEQVNNLRKEINALKLLNTELMTKLQTIEMEGHKESDMSDYQVQVLASIKELRLQMQPLKKQILSLQDQNTFQKQQSQRQRTQLQLKLYQHEGKIQHYSILMKNQQDKLIKLNETVKKHSDNQIVVKKLQQENRILGGRVIVLESKEMTVKDNSSRRLEENVLEFQTRVEMLLSQKENLANVKNISIHQLVTLKAYIAQMDQKLKNVSSENDYATRKYKSYKEKYLNSIKEIKNHQLLHNTLKTKILGYDKLVQRLQSQLEKNVNISEMQVIEQTSKTTQQQVQIQSFKKKYQSLKEKLLLQEKYNKQELETVKLNFETKIVDLTIKLEEMNTLRQAIILYKEKNQQIINALTHKENQIMELKLSQGKQLVSRNDNQATSQTQSKEFILSLQQTLRKQQTQMLKIQTQARQQQDSSRKRILGLQRQIHQTQGEFNKVKLSSSSTKYSTEKSSQQFLTENKRLRNKISELQNQLLLVKGRTAEQTSRNSYQLEFRISSLEIQKNQLSNKLQTEITYKKRLEKQLNELMSKSNQLDTELTQLTMQSNRKLQQVKYQLGEKLGLIQNLQEEIKRLKYQQKSNQQSSHLLSVSSQREQDHSMCEAKLKRLQRELENIRADNEQLRKKEGSVNASVTFNYEMESLKHQKEQARLKIERLEKEVSGLKNSLTVIEEEKYEGNRIVNGLKSQLSTSKLSYQDELFDKQRIISQLRSKVEHNQGSGANYLQIQSQLQNTISQKERQISSLRGKVKAAQNQFQRMNDTINKYNQEITSIKQTNQSSHFAYSQQMEQVIEEKSRTLKRYQEQMSSLRFQLEARQQEINIKSQALTRVQRQLNQLKEYEDEVDRLKSSLLDRDGTLSKTKFELSTYQDDNQRLKRETSSLKEEIQRLKLQMLQRDDANSSLRLQLSTLSSRLSNQIKSQMMQEIDQKQTQLSRLTFQLQSLQNNYNNIQQELNQTQARERKAQQELNYIKGQLTRSEEQLNDLTQRMIRKQTQLSQVNNEMTGLKFLQQEVNEKNSIITKLRGQMTSLRIQVSHLSEQIQYKQSTIVRQLTQLKGLRQQLLQREDVIGQKDSEMRAVALETQRLKSTIQQMQMVQQQTSTTTTRLTSQLQRTKQQKKELEQQLQEREQEWSNIQYQLNQTKTQLTLTTDQLQSNGLTIAKLSNESAFLKQEITRLNEQLVNKNQEINRVSQQVFVQKMDYTNRTSQEVQTLSNQLFGVKRQLEMMKNNVEDLQAENRRLKIELDGSRIKVNTQDTTYMYTNQDMRQLQQDANNMYREIMELQLQISQRNSQITNLNEQTNQLHSQLTQRNTIITQRNDQITHLNDQITHLNEQANMLQQKSQKLNNLLTQVEEQNHYNNQHLQSQIQQFIQSERQLRAYIEQLTLTPQVQRQAERQYNEDEQNNEELKFGLKLYTEETDRLKTIIDELTEEVSALRLKLTAYINQEDRIQQNLVTMVMTFAEVEALRDRMKVKQQEINSVRRSFIQAISSNQDVNSQYRFQAFNNPLFNGPKIQTVDVLSQKSHSIVKYKSERGNVNVNVERMMERERQLNEYDVRSQEGSQEVPEGVEHQLAEVHSMGGEDITHDERQLMMQSQTLKFETGFVKNNQFTKPQLQPQLQPQEQVQQQQVEVKLPQPVQMQHSQSSDYIEQLNQLKEEEQFYTVTEGDRVSFREELVQQLQQHHQQQQVNVTSTHQQVTTTQQRGRTINIVYQGSQVQTTTHQSRQEQQRVSHSQYQSPSGRTYVRITPNRGVVPQNVTPGVYIPQGMNIQPVRQSGASFSSQSNNQQRPVIASFPASNPSSNPSSNPPNLRY